MKKLFKKDFGEEHNFWMSYTDLMSGFLVVFIILSAILYNHYNDKVAETEKAQQEAVVKQKLYEEALASLGRASLDLEQQADIIDSLKQNNLKNLIRRYHDVFVYDEYVKVTFDTIRGSIILTNRDIRKDLFVQRNEPIMQKELKNYLRHIGSSLISRTMTIWKEQNRKNIELRIEGHTDPLWDGERGTDYGYIRNLELSSGRANLVYSYIFNNCNLSSEQKEFVQKQVISVGYSFSNRVQKNNIYDVSLDPMSRRIEFRIISK